MMSALRQSIDAARTVIQHRGEVVWVQDRPVSYSAVLAGVSGGLAVHEPVEVWEPVELAQEEWPYEEPVYEPAPAVFEWPMIPVVGWS